MIFTNLKCESAYMSNCLNPKKQHTHTCSCQLYARPSDIFKRLVILVSYIYKRLYTYYISYISK